MSEETLKIGRIFKGTVIDHIDAGLAITILTLTGIENSPNLITIGVNVPSKKMEKKDIIKIEGVFLNEVQMQQISILSPNAAISLIDNYNVIEKKKVRIPEVIKKLILCVNKTCISNSEIQCVYCDRIYKLDEIIFSSKEKVEKKISQRFQL